MKKVISWEFLREAGFNLTLLVALSYFLFPYFPPEISFKIFGKLVSVTQMLMLLALAFTGAYFLREWRAGNVYIPRSVFWLALTLGASLVVMALSTLFAGLPPNTVLIRLLSLVAIAVIVFLFSTLSKDKINELLVMAAVVAIISSILGILQFYFLGDAASPAHWLGDRQNHLFATGFGNFSSFFGTSMSLFFPLFWGLSIINYDNRRRFWLMTASFSAVGLLLSFSRSAFLAALFTVIAVSVWVWWSKLDKKFFFWSVGLMVILILFALNINPQGSWRSPTLYDKTPVSIFGERFGFLKEILTIVSSGNSVYNSEQIYEKVTSISDYSVHSRVAFHKAGLKMLADNPVNTSVGLGVDGFKDNLSLVNLGELNLDGKQTNAHSFFLETLVTGGVLGFVLMMMFLAFLYVQLVKVRKTDVLALPLVFSITAILVDGLFHTHLFVKYLWIFIGVAVAVVWRHHSTASSVTHKS